jgi:hypothetical protein
MKFGVSRFLPWKVENFKEESCQYFGPPVFSSGWGSAWDMVGRMVSETNIALKKPAMFQLSSAYDSGTARLPTTSKPMLSHFETCASATFLTCR